METSSELVWFFSSEGTAQLSYWTGTVKLHKVLNINLKDNKTELSESSHGR